ncbi:hypothetical protein [Nocardia sp. R7R-8]|uniref:hypothetical protein n=1 Tax=Nocardia sp. R7R-8 TaxID=3459304 RepID=UPI00403DAA62
MNDDDLVMQEVIEFLEMSDAEFEAMSIDDRKAVVSPEGHERVPKPDFRALSIVELDAQARHRGPHWIAAVYELTDRAAYDDTAARTAAELAKLPLLREERVFHWASATWAVINELLRADSPVARSCACEVFDTIDEAEQADILIWLKASSIELARVEKNNSDKWVRGGYNNVPDSG